MNPEIIWSQITDFIKTQINSANYRTWFSQTKLGEVQENKLTLLVPSAFVKGELARRYEDLIKEAGQQVLGLEVELDYQVDPSLLQKKEGAVEEEPEDFFQVPVLTPNTPINILNPKYTLDSFVVGSTNNLAYAATQAIVQNPGTSYNPLFIYGPSGVGKTHLMQAVGNEIVRKNPQVKIIYAPSEKFTNDFVQSLQTKRTGEFRNRYRQCEVLLIDDIQFIAGKETTQEEFFHTFNELYSKNAQIILTSDRPPNEMKNLESRLMSRFQGGLMVDIQLPDYETRMAILQAKLQERGDTLPEDVISALAEAIRSNTRELEGKLIQILQISKLQNTPVTVDSIQQYLGTSYAPTQTQKMDYKSLLNTINTYFNTTALDLAGPRRQKELVLPRQIAMFLMYEECKLPFERIGEILGGRDHTTIMHGVDKIREVMNRDREVQRAVLEIKQQITG